MTSASKEAFENQPLEFRAFSPPIWIVASLRSQTTIGARPIHRLQRGQNHGSNRRTVVRPTHLELPLQISLMNYDSEEAVGAPKMRRLRSLLPTAKYDASGPKRTDVTLPAIH